MKINVFNGIPIVIPDSSKKFIANPKAAILLQKTINATY